MPYKLLRRLALAALLPAAAAHAAPPDADPGLVQRGAFVATAGDCAGCHGADLAGGRPVESPLGAMAATNITPDAQHGIGRWSLAGFRRVLREGRSPDGDNVYPSMPFTSYTGLSDTDIKALYSYLMLGVKPVARAVPESELPFPFKRWALPVWNALYLKLGQASGAKPVQGEVLQRGQYLVEALGHCSACHTPRGQIYGEENGRHLGGGVINGWYAPNITRDVTGVGRWSDAELAAFLKSGHTPHGVAAGEMGLVVSLSTSRLPDADIAAMIAYLRAVPPVRSAPSGAGVANPRLALAEVEPQLGRDRLNTDIADGARLYQSGCASCHGARGGGPADGGFPALTRDGAARDAEGYNLVQVIAGGVNRTAGADHELMPPFRREMTPGQIAAVANYVRASFGGEPSALGPSDVEAILSGKAGTPILIANARLLAIAGLIVAAVAGLLLIARAWRRGSRANAPA